MAWAGAAAYRQTVRSPFVGRDGAEPPHSRWGCTRRGSSQTTNLGRAIEPIIRQGVEKLFPDARFGAAMFVGGYWNRDNSVEVDLVGGRSAEDATPEVD